MKEWEPHVNYPVGEVVNIGDRIFLCVLEHRSGEEFDKSNWKKFGDKRMNEHRDKNFACITSMNKDYYENIGKYMLTTYKKHWSHIMPMYVYNEDCFKIKVKTVDTRGWTLGNDYIAFQRRHTNSKVKVFAKKAYPIIDAMYNLNCDRLIWVDADTVITGSLPPGFVELLCPDDVLSAHFSVWHEKDDKTYHSCETGFFVLNKRHEGFADFASTYKEIYNKDKTEGMRRFYDGEVYGRTVELMQEKGYKMNNLNPARHKTPISRSAMAPYITHFKAGLKDRVELDEMIKNQGIDISEIPED